MKFGELILLAIGGWALYEYVTGGFSGAAAAAPGSGTPAPNTNAYNSLAAIAARIQADVANNNEPAQMSAYQWNFYYQRNTTIPSPPLATLFPGANLLTATFTWAQYWSAVSQALSAQGMSGGMGVLAYATRSSLGGYYPLSTYPPENQMNPPPSNSGQRLPPGGAGMSGPARRRRGMGYMGLGYMGMGAGKWIY
jgi:hypothetical protein